MKKLLYFASDFQIGLSALLTDQLISLQQSGIDVVAVAGSGQQEQGLETKLHSHNVDLIRIPGLDEHKNFKQLSRAIRDLILSRNISIVHVQNNWQLAIMGYVKTLLWPKRRIEIIYTLHAFRHNHPVKAKIAKLVIGSALLLVADHVVCMTRYLKKNFSLLSYKTKLLPLGINDEFFLSEFLPPKVDALRLIFPAQFRKGKNQDLIIQAFHSYCTATNDRTSTLTLPGSGPLLNQMKELASSLNLEKQVIFPGQLSKEEIKNAYLQSNVAIVASNSETFGQSIVEPYVLGRCVLSTPVGVATEIIHNNNGFLFGNASQLTDILRTLAADKNRLVEIGFNNFNERNQFAWSEITRQYKQLFLL